MGLPAKTDDFLSTYDRYSKMYVDPVEVLFQIAADVGVESGIRVSAANNLVSYRYPKHKSIDLTAGEGVKGLTFIMGSAAITHVHNIKEQNNQILITPKIEFGMYMDKPKLLRTDGINDTRIIEHD